MIGQAVEKAPDLAREIVRRGQEPAAQGRAWQSSYFLDSDVELRFITDCVETIQKVAGQQAIGWNAYWMRNSAHTLDTLQSLDFKCHINEPSTGSSARTPGRFLAQLYQLAAKRAAGPEPPSVSELKTAVGRPKIRVRQRTASAAIAALNWDREPLFPIPKRKMLPGEFHRLTWKITTGCQVASQPVASKTKAIPHLCLVAHILQKPFCRQLAAEP
jgi:peptidoglycan/xylan/chitin deacetylase (PgdA/CDA1 family)